MHSLISINKGWFRSKTAMVPRIKDWYAKGAVKVPMTLTGSRIMRLKSFFSGKCNSIADRVHFLGDAGAQANVKLCKNP
jgi:hypothetical protein